MTIIYTLALLKFNYKMKKIVVFVFLVAHFNVNASISRLSDGITYCTNQYPGNFIIDWKRNLIILKLAGSDTYKIIKEVKNRRNKELVITARKYYGNEYLEFKLFSSPKGDFFRAWDKDTKLYPYKAEKLTCWEEQR